MRCCRRGYGSSQKGEDMRNIIIVLLITIGLSVLAIGITGAVIVHKDWIRTMRIGKNCADKERGSIL